MYRKFFKRFFDITLSLIALTVLSPILIPVIIGLLLTGEHYVFYFQKRIGYKNKPFDIWKFATMLKASPDLPGGIHTVRNDPRLMPLGGFLRKTKINEVPQLVNILIGDMSIIGPRPLVDKTFNPYPEHVKAKIYDVRPGMTGIGSIVFRDEEKLLSETYLDRGEFYAKYISPYKGELELWYQDHLTFYTDFMLVFLTGWVILFPNSELVYRVFGDLPGKPEFLRQKIKVKR
jgi:lipopolysaccharide/colanic/teichoic acid biosynthesis glycosyltransferase